MGVWLRARGRLEVAPEPDDKLLMEFWHFGESNNPEEYQRIDECFLNTWFFDESNKLACLAGKFSEPIIWMDFLKEKFFAPRGFEVIGDMDIIGEGDSELFNENLVAEYEDWKKRVAAIISEQNCDKEQ